MRCTCGRRVCGEGGGCRGEIIRHRYVAESEKNEKPVAAPVIPAPRHPVAGTGTSERPSHWPKIEPAFEVSRARGRDVQQRDVPQPGVVTTDVKQEQKCDKKEACAACWVVIVHIVRSALQLHAAQSRCLLSAVLVFKGGLFGIHTCCIHYRPSICYHMDDPVYQPQQCSLALLQAQCVHSVHRASLHRCENDLCRVSAAFLTGLLRLSCSFTLPILRARDQHAPTCAT